MFKWYKKLMQRIKTIEDEISGLRRLYLSLNPCTWSRVDRHLRYYIKFSSGTYEDVLVILEKGTLKKVSIDSLYATDDNRVIYSETTFNDDGTTNVTKAYVLYWMSFKEKE